MAGTAKAPKAKAHSKKTNGKKKLKAAVSKSSVKKLPAPAALKWKRLHPVAASLEQGTVLMNSDWKFDNLGTVLRDISRNHKGNLCVFLGNEFSQCGTTVTFIPIIHVLLLPEGLNQPPPFLRRKAHDGKLPEIVDFSSLKFKWERMDDLVPGLESPVFGLVCTRNKKNMCAPSLDGGAAYEYTILMDCRPSKAFPRHEEGKLEGKLKVDFVSFDFELDDGTVLKDISFDKAMNRLSTFSSGFCDEHGLDEDVYCDKLNAAIKDAFAKKRDNMEREEKRVMGCLTEDTDLLENVTCAKIYPSNFAELVPGGQENRVPQTDHEYGPAENNLVF